MDEELLGDWGIWGSCSFIHRQASVVMFVCCSAPSSVLLQCVARAMPVGLANHY